VSRFKLVIEYAGTRYSGWQIQKNAKTVQGEIARVIGDVTGQRKFELYGSGRTDAGVHALEQVAHLDIITSLAPELLHRQLNDGLPSDINVLSLAPAQRRFHARHDAVARSYVYQLARRRTAFAKNYVWWVREHLNVQRMRDAAARFSGMQNFKSFTDDDPEDKSTIVAVHRIDIAEDGDLILIRVEGSHFLWKMVRRIVGVLVEVGRGVLPLDAVAGFLIAESDIPAKLTAPASGLFLERVYYSDREPRPPLRGCIELKRQF
jgi:tRNA pseudouridine38-40 synthase